MEEEEIGTKNRCNKKCILCGLPKRKHDHTFSFLSINPITILVETCGPPAKNPS